MSTVADSLEGSLARLVEARALDRRAQQLRGVERRDLRAADAGDRERDRAVRRPCPRRRRSAIESRRARGPARPRAQPRSAMRLDRRASTAVTVPVAVTPSSNVSTSWPMSVGRVVARLGVAERRAVSGIDRRVLAGAPRRILERGGRTAARAPRRAPRCAASTSAWRPWELLVCSPPAVASGLRDRQRSAASSRATARRVIVFGGDVAGRSLPRRRVTVTGASVADDLETDQAGRRQVTARSSRSRRRARSLTTRARGDRVRRGEVEVAERDGAGRAAVSSTRAGRRERRR